MGEVGGVNNRSARLRRLLCANLALASLSPLPPVCPQTSFSSSSAGVALFPLTHVSEQRGGASLWGWCHVYYVIPRRTLFVFFIFFILPPPLPQPLRCYGYWFWQSLPSPAHHHHHPSPLFSLLAFPPIRACLCVCVSASLCTTPTPSIPPLPPPMVLLRMAEESQQACVDVVHRVHSYPLREQDCRR